MAVYLSVDGGGSKLTAILFTDKLQLLARARTQGVNRNSTSAEDAAANITRCADELLAGFDRLQIKKAYITFLGDPAELYQAFASRADVEEYVTVGELKSGLLAGGLRSDGFLAMAGTGSNVLLLPGPHMTPAMEGKLLKVGGWGAVMGDEGSGVWMGVKTAQAAIASWEGWGERNSLFERIMQCWQLREPYDLKRLVYRQPSPHRQLGQLTRLLGKAAEEGDKAAADIIRSAGEIMARQVLCLIDRCGEVPEALHHLVCSGGAWKVHPIMFETFSALLHNQVPWLEVHKPLFEPVIAGCLMALEENGFTRQEAAAMIAQKLPEECIRW